MICGSGRAAVLASFVAAASCWGALPCAAQVATLEWSAPRGCPDTAFVAKQLAGSTEAGAAQPELRVRARVRASGRGVYVLRLWLRGQDFYAERQLEAHSCASVTDAAVWLINVALARGQDARVDDASTADTPASSVGQGDGAPAQAAASTTDASGSLEHAGEVLPSSSAAPSERATQQRVGAVDPTKAASSAAATTESSVRASSLVYPARRAPWRRDWAELPRWWRVGAFTGLWSAALPAPQLSVGARLGFGIGALYAELWGAAELSRGRRLADATVARFATQDVGLSVCAQWGAGLRGGPCATAAVLRTTGGSRRAPEGNEQALAWSAAGIALALGWRAPRGLEVMLETGLQLPVSARPRFTVEGVGEVAVAAPVNVYARLGLGFRSADIRREQ